MPVTAPEILPTVVAQHIEGAADLRTTRSTLVRAPHVDLQQLARHDERIRAHLDGIAVSGETGYSMAQEVFEGGDAGHAFALTIAAIGHRDCKQIDSMLSLVGTVPNAEHALASAFGWVSAESLRGFTTPMLTSADPLQTWLGISACALHRVDPGVALAHAFAQPDDRVRAWALRAVGQLGKLDFLQACLAHLTDPQPICRFQAAWSAALLGGGQLAATALKSIALQSGPHTLQALRVLLLAVTVDGARSLVRQLATAGVAPRTVIQATGWAGDPGAVGWLVKQMGDDPLARVAGEAFTTITGADLAKLGLERNAPENLKAGPTENPEDENVDMDPDDSLPWPDAAKIQAWWQSNQARFSPGVRYFMGAPPSVSHCREVLREGFQRQRIAAAEYLCLLQPGTPLFNIAAPAWRQQRALLKLK